MEELENLAKQLAVQKFEIGRQYWVSVKHIVDPHNFYVIPLEYEDSLALLEKHGGPLSNAEMHLGKKIIFYSVKMKQYARGEVRAMHPGHLYTVFAIDYGFQDEHVDIGRIHRLPAYLDLPPLAVHCELADCAPGQGAGAFTASTIHAMKTFVGDEPAKMKIQSIGQKLKVNLFNSCPDDVSTLLALVDFTSLGLGPSTAAKNLPKPPSSISDMMKFDNWHLKVGDEIHVRVQSGDSLEEFYVGVAKDYIQFTKDRQDFTLYCKSQPDPENSAIKPGLAVGVLSTHLNYERAIIKEILVPGEKASLFMIDWGKHVDATFDKLKMIRTQKYFRIPPYALYCTCDPSQAWETGYPRFLMLGSTFNIRIKEVGNHVDIPHVVDIFKSKM